MAIADFSTYKSLLTRPFWTSRLSKGTLTGSNGRLTSMWNGGVADTGAIPTTAAVPTNATAGSARQPNADTGQLAILEAKINAASQGIWVLCDRLSHQGGLSGTVTTAQTTNLPTAALTRYTTGAGVWVGLEIHTQIGATGTTVTASYTDQNGTAGNTTNPVVFGGTGFREVARMIPLTLAAADTGVRSVESVTVLATTGTAGAFGVVLYKPLLALPVIAANMEHEYDALLGMTANIPEIVDNACLWWVCMVSGAATTGLMQASLKMSEV